MVKLSEEIEESAKQPKDWPALLKGNPSDEILVAVVISAPEPHKEEAWNMLSKREKIVDYLGMIIDQGSEPYTGLAKDKLLKEGSAEDLAEVIRLSEKMSETYYNEILEVFLARKPANDILVMVMCYGKTRDRTKETLWKEIKTRDMPLGHLKKIATVGFVYQKEVLNILIAKKAPNRIVRILLVFTPFKKECSEYLLENNPEEIDCQTIIYYGPKEYKQLAIKKIKELRDKNKTP